MNEPQSISQKENSEKDQASFSIQEILSIGYIVLIIIGIYLEFMKYSNFGINIIEHSDFTDFLIAPFKDMFLIGVPIIGGLFLLFLDGFSKKRKLQNKKITNEENNIKELDLQNQKNEGINYKGFITWSILLFISVNIGVGIGNFARDHKSVQKKLDANITNTRIQFMDGKTKEVYLYGKNTSYLFYFENNKIDLIVSPIPGNIKAITYIPKN